MYEIIPNLFLAGYHSVNVDDPHTFVVNCTMDLPMKSQHNMRIAVDDDGSKQSLDHMFLRLSETADRIHDELTIGNKVVVHCLAGQQRSPAVVAAYLMKHHAYSLEDAIRYIRAKKPDAFFWSINFLDSLQRFASFNHRV